MGDEWPEDCVQGYCNDWWIHDSSATLVRGRLLWTFVAYPDVKPLRLVPEGRGDDPTDHNRFKARIEAFEAGHPPKPAAESLPVAAMPLFPGESYVLQRGKTRPVVILSTGGDDIPRAVRAGGARWQASSRLIVAPYYLTDQGWNPQFVRRIRHAEWPQYMWDRLAVTGHEDGSVLRLDQMFPLGKEDRSAYRMTEYRLSDEALAILDEWLGWVVFGKIKIDGPLAYLRGQFLESERPADG